jgi:hypothetical protein
MMMTRLLALLSVAALCLFASSVCTATTISVEWAPSDWQCSNNPYHPGVPLLEKTWEWEATWGVGNSTVYELYGAPPGNDPDVSQIVRNRTQVKWTDWHVDLINGTYVANSAVVFNVQRSNPHWVVLPSETGKGFVAHVISGMNTQVNNMEQLSVFFSYTVDDPGQSVSITQYPTNDYPIPEPGTILSLVSGCLAFGFFARRRVI